jgi:uncharacterized membrane protein YheB (UPF0754 family)
MKNFASNLQAELDLEKLVADKINTISLDEAEAMFKRNLSAEIRRLSILAASTGLLIGALTALILVFIH